MQSVEFMIKGLLHLHKWCRKTIEYWVRFAQQLMYSCIYTMYGKKYPLTHHAVEISSLNESR